MRAYQDGLAQFEQAGAQVLGLSVDAPRANKKFAEKLGLTFPLLSDSSKQVSKVYGVLSIFRMAKRVTFVVDRQGVIRHVDEGRAALDPANALQACRAL
jgi:peroxiredoxin